jgi:hypothetical protein
VAVNEVEVTADIFPRDSRDGEWDTSRCVERWACGLSRWFNGACSGGNAGALIPGTGGRTKVVLLFILSETKDFLFAKLWKNFGA